MLLALGVDASRRLVEDVGVGVLGKGGGDHDAPLLAAGECVEAILAAVLEADLSQRVGDGPAITAAWQPVPGRNEARAHDLVHRYGDGASGLQALRHVGDALP